MYTNKKNVLELVSLMKEHGIQDVVLCPGSRDIPIVRALSKTPYFRCLSVTDERSAAFIALGICIRNKKPCAVVTTSGSALLNTAPAISEAFYQKLPLLVISADRARSWIDQMDGQTIEQNCIFSKFVKYETTLPEVLDADSLWHCNRLCNEVLLTLNAKDKGPVHINVPISDPFFTEDVEELPKARVIKEGEFKDVFKEIDRHQRILLVIGQNLHTLKFNQDNVELLKKYIVISHEHLSNVDSNDFVQNIDTLLLSYDNKEKLLPDLVITLGGHFVSKQVRLLLRNKDIYHINIVESNTISDLFCSLRMHVFGNPILFMRDLTSYLKVKDKREEKNLEDDANLLLNDILDDEIFIEGVDDKESFESKASKIVHASRQDKLTSQKEYAEKFYELSATIREPSLAEFNQISVTGELLERIDRFDRLYLANSSTVRYAQLFKLSSNPYVQVNRGVNGIEGSLSTFIGASIRSDKLFNTKLNKDKLLLDVLNTKFNNLINFNKRDYLEDIAPHIKHTLLNFEHNIDKVEEDRTLDFIIIGDLSFFYDMNALFNHIYSNNIRILLVNNQGGEIFSNIKGLSMNDRDREFIVAPHNFDARGWAQSCNLEYLCARDKESFDNNLVNFINRDSDKGIIFEVFCDKNTDVEFFKAYIKNTKEILCKDNGNQ